MKIYSLILVIYDNYRYEEFKLSSLNKADLLKLIKEDKKNFDLEIVYNPTEEYKLLLEGENGVEEHWEIVIN